MSLVRSIRDRRGRRRTNTAFELQLTSMMDVLVIIVVFLLKSYTASTSPLTVAKGLELPASMSANYPADSHQVIVTPQSITFEDERVLDFAQTEADLGDSKPLYRFRGSDVDEGGNRILPLYDVLVRAREKAEASRQIHAAKDAQGNPAPFEGVLAIQADKGVRYDILRKIMYTAGSAGFRVFRFVAMQKDS